MSAVEERVIETDSKVGEASIKSVIIDIALLLLSAILFALSFPNFLSRWGWFPLAYISLFPVFVVVHRSGWYRIVVYGLLYGFLSYSLFNFWLLKFHPLAIIIVPVIYAIYFLLLFPLLKLADSLFPRYGYLIQAVIWVGYEYLKTRGFLGYSYGVIGYSQYLFLPLIRVSDLTGVWGISFLVIFPSCWLGNTIKKGRRQLNLFFKEHRTELFAYSALFLAAVIYGIVSTADLSGAKKWRVALIQHNVDPWKHDYDESLDILIRLSEEAVKKYPHIVMWSETAFVPSIAFHTRYRANHQYYRLIERLKEFLGRQDVPYLIGNDDAELKRVGGVERIDYNAALLYMDGG
ncbi:MAG: apolipoprotein N-acyltransferase, partial [Spirochaetes bacterium]